MRGCPFCKGLLGCLRVRSKRKKTPQITCWNPEKDIGVDTPSLRGPGATGPFLASSCTPLYPCPVCPEVPILLGPSISSHRQQATVTPTPVSFLSPVSRHNCFPLKDQGADAGWTWVTQRSIYKTIPISTICPAQPRPYSTAKLILPGQAEHFLYQPD